jgi:tetratricopeptide (TPR) repeat protein
MRTAYSGRAAAYEKKGDYEKALADHKMAVLYYAIEAEILNNLQAPDRAKFLAECANAYRARSKCLEVLGKLKEAEQDRKWADGIETDAKKLEVPALSKTENAGGIEVINTWTQPVTLVIAGTSHRLNIGERKTIPASSGSVPYEMQAGVHRASGTLEVGKTYTIRPTP